LSDKSIGLGHFLVNLLSDFRNLLSGSLNSGLQLSGLRSIFFNSRGDSRFSILEVSFLLLNDSGKLFLSFLGRGVNFLTGIFRFFFFLLDFSNDGLLGLLNLMNEVGDLLLNDSGLLLDNLLLILLSFNLLLNDTDLLISFLSDSGGLRFNELGFVDFSHFFLVNGL
jgi:hypothetical protein